LPAMADVLGTRLKSPSFFEERATTLTIAQFKSPTKVVKSFNATPARGQMNASVGANLELAIRNLDQEAGKHFPNPSGIALDPKPGKSTAETSVPGPDDWQRIHDFLKQKYPKAPPRNPFAFPAGADSPKAPKRVSEEPVYKGRPAAFWLEQ